MAKGPDLTNPAENPGYETHVSNTKNMIGSANGNQRIAGVGWYHKAAQDVSDIANGIHPGRMDPHPNSAWAERGITADKAGTTNETSRMIRNQRAESHGHDMDRAASFSQGHAESLARSGYYPGQQMSHRSDMGAPFGGLGLNPKSGDISTAVAATSPAGPTGMTWDNNPRAVADATHLNEDQFQNIVKANLHKPGTPERKAASEVAREPFKGTAMNHQTTGNMEKGVRALHGEYRGVQNPLGNQKTQHFANDIESEFHPTSPLHHSGMTGTVDKHQEDVIAGHTKPWGNKDAAGNQIRTASTRAVGEDSLPKVSSDKGYAYQRGVVQQASSEMGMRPKEGQATSWVAQKVVKDAARRKK